MAKNNIELLNSIAVFLCLLVFHARSIKQKSVTLKIKKHILQYGFFMPCQGIDFTFFENFEIFVFFEKKVGPTNFLQVFFHSKGFCSTQNMLWRIEEYAKYQVFMQISWYSCKIWLIVRWGPSSPQRYHFHRYLEFNHIYPPYIDPVLLDSVKII